MQKSRIVAIALISIILSSSSFSVADGNTVWLQKTLKDVKNESKFYKIILIDNAAASIDKKSIGIPQPYQINLIDAVSASISDNIYDKDPIYQINIFDGILSTLNNDNKNTDLKQKLSVHQEKITINLSDGISSITTDFGGDDSKIMLIKQNHDKKALWERIFPLDRIRNISKSFFKIIQNDHILSYLQISEISSNKDDYSIEQTTIYGLELKNLSEFEKFVGKTGYVYDQIGIRALNLLDVDKFISKSGYVSDQIAIRAQHLADPEKFVGKSRFVGQQITIQVYQVVDPKNPTLLVLLIPLVGIVLIRNENDKIKFYHIQKIISFIFAVILISSAVITPFSYSVMYWGRAFAQEDPLGKDAGPPEEPIVEQLVETVKDVIDEITEPPPAEELSEEHAADLPLELPVEEPIAELPVETLPEEPIQLPPGIPADTTTQEQNNIIIPTRNDLTTTFDENIVLTDDHSNELEQIQNNQTISLSESFNLIDIISLNNETQQTQNNQTILFNETIVLTDTITSPNIPQNKSESLPEYISFIDDIILSLQNQTNIVLPNATESWQFENDTSDVTFNDDAEIDYTEGINGTSLILDGQLDYAQTNRTNATTYITDMSIAAWVKPNYTNGSPEFTVVSKGKSFVLSINNIIDPQHVAKFAVFDGIKWTTVESYSTIPDSSWSHITARFNKTSIALYVNGTLEGTVTHGGVPYITEKGQIELKTLQEITSYYDIVIGAALKPNMDDRPYNMFSGMIDGVQLFDYRLGPDDVMNLYLSTIPIKAPIIPPEIRRPEPVLRYRVIKGNETLPISIPVDDLNEDLNQLTVSTWIKPNFTGGSPEFTVLSRENSFILSLNKIVLPERVAKFSVYNGISWHTATGSTPIDGWTHVAAVINGSSILIYVNGTLDGKLETGPPWIAGSTANVIIGAYENTNRGDVKWSNYYFGEIGEATVWEYSMVDHEIMQEYRKNLLVYQPQNAEKIIVSLQSSIKTDEYTSKPNDTSIPNNYTKTESLSITDELILNLNGIPIITLQEYMVFYDNLTLALNQNKVNGTILPQTLTLTDSLYLKLNNTTYTYLEESLVLSEDILLILNNQTVTFSNSTSRLTHGIIEIGKPVDWTQTVMLNETDPQNILLELPADAQNITIAKTEQGTLTDIPEEEIIIIESELEPVENEYDIPRQKDIVLDKIANEYSAEHVVPLDYATLKDLDEVKQKDKPTVALLINETRFDVNETRNIIPQNNTQTEYTVKFQTPAPYALEQDYSTSEKYQKNVTIAHNSTLHYTDVKSYTDIPEYLVLHNTQFKLYWMINGSRIDVTHDQRFNVTFADADANGVTDRMEWIVPQLSEQEFGVEADITIINVQSYPIVGGNWTVYFNTTGTADLTIEGIDGTTFGNGIGNDDLKFLELNNGTHTLSPIINLTANTITYHNYTSNYTGFEASQVLTPGTHHLKFQFGNDVGFAHNNAKIFQDNFNRADSGTVGNGWVETDPLPGTDYTDLNGNRLRFVSNDALNEPQIKHTFELQTTGKIKWTYTFDWARTGLQGTYVVRMQLGHSGTMNDASPLTTGVAVNLLWGNSGQFTVGGADQTFGRATVGNTVRTGQAVISGETTVTVTADLDAETYDLELTGPGFSSGTRLATGIPFDNAGLAGIDEVRIFTDNVQTTAITPAKFDDMVIEKVNGDIEVAVGRFTLSSTPGYQKITGVGFEPKAILFFSTPNVVNNVDSVSGDGMGYSIGMTDGKDSFVVATSTDDALGANDVVGRRALEDYVILRLDNNQDDQRAVGLAALASLDPDGFTLYLQDDFQEPDGGFVEYVAFGGHGVTPQVGRVTLENNGQEIDVTGIGFEPDLIISSFVGAFNRGEAEGENDDSMMSFGWAVNPDIQAANNQFSMTVGKTDVDASQTNSWFSTTYAGTGVQNNGNEAGYEFTDFFAGGFTVTTRIEDSSNNPVDAFEYLALDLGEKPEVYTTSRAARAVAGQDVVTGAGFQPAFLMATGSAVVDSGETNVRQDNGASFFVGITNSTKQYSVELYNQDAADPSNAASRTDENSFIQAPIHSGAINYEADFVSFDADGWTLNYNDPADDDYQIAFLAIGDNYYFTAPPAVQLMQPDAGVPGMHLAVNFIGDHFNSTQVVSTDSPFITVGPTIVINEKSVNVTKGGQVLQTIFFIDGAAPPGDVTVSIDGVDVIPKFKIIDTNDNFAGTGDYSTAAPGTYTLGDDQGVNGNRTVGGTIVLENLIVPDNVILNIDTTDPDPTTAGNEGFLPAIIIVEGNVDIDGIIYVNGTDGQNGQGDVGGDGGSGGPGGGGGGSGATDDGNGGKGGDGFTGGGGGGCDEDGTRLAAIGGTGTGGIGLSSHRVQCEGSSGGGALIGNRTGGGPGGEHNADNAGGGGGTGFVFGSGGTGGIGETDVSGNGYGGLGGGGGGDSGDNRKGGGGGFGEAGTEGGNDASATGGGLPGRINGNVTLIPIAGGSGGGGGGTDDDGAGLDDGSGGGGGGGGAILIFGQGIFDVTTNGRIDSGGGDGGTTTDDADSGEGGGGSGGGIVLQGISVDTSAGTLSADGAYGPNGGGDGGDGRIRVDGVRLGAITIEGLGTFGGSEYVGPSITGFNGTHINGTGGPNANVTLVVMHSTGGTDYYRYLQVDSNREYSLEISFTDGDHYITAIQNSTFTDAVMSSVATHIVFKRTMMDSVSTRDYAILVMRVRDDVGSVDDIIVKAPATMRPYDKVAVSDVLSIYITKLIDDSVSTRDYAILVMHVQDDLASVDDILVKAPATMRPYDTPLVDDAISFNVTKVIADSASVDDSIKYSFVIFIEDETASVDDIIVKAPATMRPYDTPLVDDAIRFSVTKVIADSASVDDVISWTLARQVNDDLASVDDILVKAPATMRPYDTPLVDDAISFNVTKVIADSASVDDSIKYSFVIFIEDETASVDDIIVKAPATMRPYDTPLVDDAIRFSVTKVIADSASVDDVISWTLARQVNDDLASVDDILVKAPATMRPYDTPLVDDAISFNVTKVIADSASVDDSIKYSFVIFIEDETASVDDIIVKAPATMRPYDTPLVDDAISFNVTKVIADSASVDDSIKYSFVIFIEDETASVDDIIVKAPATMRPYDTPLVDDAIRFSVTKVIADSASVDDVLTSQIIKTIHDSSIITDTIISKLTRSISDYVLFDDTITFSATMRMEDIIQTDDELIVIILGLSKRFIKDSASVDDSPSIQITKRLSDTALLEDKVSSRIINSILDSSLVDDNIQVTFGKLLFDSGTVNDILQATAIKVLQDSAIVDDVLRATRITVLEDAATVDDNIQVTFGKLLFDSGTVNDILQATAIKVLQDSAIVDDVLRATRITVLEDAATVDDNIQVTFGKLLFDSGTVNDILQATAIKVLQDSAIVDDVLRATRITVLEDAATVDDNIQVTFGKLLFDSGTVNDILQATAIKVLQDSAIVDDVLRATRITVLEDAATVDDNIQVTFGKLLFDSGTVNDILQATAIKVLQDSAIVDDVLRATRITVLEDAATVDDNIQVTFGKLLFDSGTVSDSLTKTVIYRLQDSASIQDDIIKHVFSIMRDQVLVDDNIKVIPGKLLFDSGTVSDSLTKTVIYRLQDSASIQDDITKVAFSLQSDNVRVDDIIRITLGKPLFDSGTVSDSLTKTVIYRLQDSASIQDDITKVAFSLQSDNVRVDDIIRITLGKPLFDSGTVSDSLTKTVIYRLQDSASIQDDITKVAFSLQSDNVRVDDIIRITLGKPLFDSGTVSDSLTKTVIYRLQDSASIQDDIIKHVFSIMRNQVRVDDNIRVTLGKPLFDSGTVSDSLTKTVIYRLQDSASIQDDIIKHVFSIMRDQVRVDDNIRVTLGKPLFDSGTVDETISIRVTYRVQDTISVDDKLFFRFVHLLADSATIDDVIRITLGKPLFDSGTVSDSLTKTVIYRLQDSVLVQDDIIKHVFSIMRDQVLVDDNIRVTLGKPLFDSGTVDETISIRVTYRLQDTILADDNLFFRFVHLLADSATINDVIRVTLGKPLFDSGTVSDSITKTVFYRIQDAISVQDIPSKRVSIVIGDEIGLVEDIIRIAPVTYRPNDISLIDDTIQKTVTYRISDAVSADEKLGYRITKIISDSATVADLITWKLSRSVEDSALVEDTLRFRATLNTKDSATTDNVISLTFTGIISDISSVDDSITWTLIRAIADTVLAEDSINLTITKIFADSSITTDHLNWTLTRVIEGDAVAIDDILNWIRIKTIADTSSVDDSINLTLTIIPPPPPPPIPFGQGPIRVGPTGVAGGSPDMPTARIHRVEYDVCNENIVRILAAHDSSSPPRIQLLTTKSGVIDATLSINQPFANQNKVTLIDKYLFEAPLATGESVFTIFAVDYHSNVQRTLVQVEGCTGTLVFVDDQIVLPHIFDIKYKTLNGTDIRPETGYHYINKGQDMTVSAIVQSPIIPLAKAELFFTTLGTGQQKVISMDISPLVLPDLENVSIISGIIPANLLKGPAVEFWIRIVTEEGVVQESVHRIIGVKPEVYDSESSVEMDTITIKAQGTTLKPTAYLTNEGDIPVYSEVSLVADGKKVYSIPVLLTPGQNIINLEWSIPKTGDTARYKMQTQLDVYDKSYITGMATLDTFTRTKIVSMYHQSEIVPATDELGNVIARPAMMYSSNEGSGEFRVTAPDGTCVIGAGCLVEQSTLKHRGGIDSVLIDGHIYRVRYSGENSPLERFSITSLDSVLGEWNVKIIENSQFVASAAEDVPIKVQYRAERSPIVTVVSELENRFG